MGSEDDKGTLPDSVISMPRSVSDAEFGGVSIGTKIADTYRVVGRLGEGAMGVVRLARDENLDRHVAIKLVRPELLTRAAATERLRDEARAMAKVRHPNVVTIYAYGDHEGTPYFVMEYVQGMDLETWTLAQGGPPLPVGVATAVLRDVGAGVQAIHAAGAVHGDLKPSNVLISEDNRVLVADLGLVKFLNELAEGQRADVMGTPAYMAPEILSARLPSAELAPRIDVYSLAVIAYELFTGRLPFVEQDIVRLLNMHATLPPPPPTSLGDLPASLDEVLLGALDKDPAMRTGSVAELIEGIEQAVGGVQTADADTWLVLLDDDEDFLAFASTALRSAFPGARISAFTQPDEALAAIADGASAALIDLEMPDANGLEVLAEARATRRDHRVPIAVVTGVGSAKDWKVLSELGADAFLAKPVQPDELARTVRRLLDRRSLRPPPPSRPPLG